MTPEQNLADTSRLSRLGFGTAAAVLAAIGTLLAVAWIAVFVPTFAFVARARATEGVYVGSVSHVGGNHGGTFLRPQFRFRTSDGRTVTFTSHDGSTDQPFEEDQKVRVLYEPGSPTAARRDSFSGLWLSSLFLGIFTALMLGMAFLFMRAARRL